MHFYLSSSKEYLKIKKLNSTIGWHALYNENAKFKQSYYVNGHCNKSHRFQEWLVDDRYNGPQ